MSQPRAACSESTGGLEAGTIGSDSGLPLLFGAPTSAVWREDVLTRVIELEGLAAWVKAELGEDKRAEQLVGTINKHLQAARNTATGGDRPWRARLNLWARFRSSFGGSSFERTLGNLDAVEAHLLRLAPPDYLRSLLPSIQAHVNRHLPKQDPRWESLTSVVKKVAQNAELSKAEQGAAVAAYHAANSQRRREFLRLRSFRNMLLAATAVLLIVGAGLGTIGSIHPNLIPLCFNPDKGTENGKVVCPTEETLAPQTPSGTFVQAAQALSFGSVQAATPPTADGDIDSYVARTVSRWDLWLVELVGLVAAAVASAFALRGIRGASTPISLPVALAVLKLATGALTAFLGLLLMRGGFVPGLSALDTSAQILSWAIVFGYAQQLFTRFVDQQANTVAEGIHGRGAAGDRPTTRRAGQSGRNSSIPV